MSRVLGGRNYGAEPEMQPWRCKACGTAVRPGMGDPCRCLPPQGPRTVVHEADHPREPKESSG